MKNGSGHVAIIAGVIGAAVMSLSGLAAWPRAEGAQRSDLKVSPLPPNFGDIAQSSAHQLRDLSAIKASQIPLTTLRNPFRTAAAPPADTAAKDLTRTQLLTALQALRCDSILCTAAARSCSINRKTLAEGNAVGNFTVEKINAGSVTLKSGIYRFELRVQQ